MGSAGGKCHRHPRTRKGEAGMLTFPAHKGAMHISHNDHKNQYQTAEDWATDNEQDEFADWISEEERAKAISEDSIWTLQWYPETPVGFCCVAASSFEALMAYFAGRTALEEKQG
jgi:hypothetical protein